MKKFVSFILALALCISCAAGVLFVHAEEAEVALPDFYKTCYDDYSCTQCAGTASKEGGVPFAHITGDAGTQDAYFFPQSGWGPTLDHPVMLLKYRTSGGAGELFFASASTTPGSEGTHTEVEFPAAETEWQYLTFDFKENGFASFETDDEAVTFFRVDLNSIEWMDYSFVAFFKTVDEANAFEEAEKAGKVKLFKESSVITTRSVVSPRQMDPMQFNGHLSVAVEFTVPEGQSFKAFVLTEAPTWNAQENSTLDAVIYAWNEDYDTTIEGIELGTFREEQHRDNSNITMDFGVLLPPGKYVIVMTANDDPIGAWGGNMDEINFDALFYFDDMESDTWFPYSAIILVEGTEQAIELPTAAPTAEPTEKPTEKPTEVPTEVPTEAPTEAPTDVPTEAPTEEPKNNGCGGLVLSGLAVIAVAAAAFVLRKKD